MKRAPERSPYAVTPEPRQLVERARCRACHAWLEFLTDGFGRVAEHCPRCDCGKAVHRVSRPIPVPAKRQPSYRAGLNPRPAGQRPRRGVCETCGKGFPMNRQGEPARYCSLRCGWAARDKRRAR